MKLVLLPGMDGTGRLFEPLLKNLPSHISPLVVAYPASRIMSYDALVALVRERLPAEPFILLGESFSGPIAMRLATARPKHLCGVILAASFVTSPISRPLRPFMLLADLACRLPVPQQARSFFALGAMNHPLRQSMAKAVSEVEPGVLADRLRQMNRLDIDDQVRSCSLPVAYLAPTRDWLVSRQCLPHLQALLPHLKIHPIKAPHLVLQACPVESAEIIAAFCHAWLESNKDGTTIQ